MPSQTGPLLMLVDSDGERMRSMAAGAQRHGWQTICLDTQAEALERLACADEVRPGAILFNAAIAASDALQFIAQCKARSPECDILVLTAPAVSLQFVEAVRAGASDCLVAPVAPENLAAALSACTADGELSGELQPFAHTPSPVLEFDAMVGTDGPFRTALARAATASRGQGHVLVEGESGTGKDMLMLAMHHASGRARSAMARINCRHQAETGIESRLFGHEKGAFPGAFDRQEGALARLDGGTILLGNIDQLPLALQERLDDALETGIVRPTGASHGFRTDVRIIAASDRPLQFLVQDGLFLPKLAERISGTRIALPPLRERAGDIPALTRYFLSRIGEMDGLKHHSIADSGLALLEAYDWPGNVRQLQSTLLRAAIHEQREALTAHSFPQLAKLVGTASRADQRTRGLGVLLYEDDGNIRPLEEIEADIIRLAIGHYRGKMTEVARRLGIGRSTLYRKLNELGIDNAA